MIEKIKNEWAEDKVGTILLALIGLASVFTVFACIMAIFAEDGTKCVDRHVIIISGHPHVLCDKRVKVEDAR